MSRRLTVHLCIALFMALVQGLSAQEQVKDTNFSVRRGYFTSSFHLEITSNTAGAAIYYTTDASLPSVNNGTLYTQPINITGTTIIRAIATSPGMDPSNVDTQTYIFQEDIVNQPGDPPGFPATWTSTDGFTIPADYEMDPEYPDNNRSIENSLLSLPAVSIVVEPENLFTKDGVYTNGGSSDNNDWEKPCSFEFIFADTTEGFQIDCGIQPRSQTVFSTPKRNFKLDFKSVYGPGKLNEPVFDMATILPETAPGTFNSIILRSGYMENYTGKIYNPYLNIYFRDIMVRDAQLLVSGFGTHNVFVHLYLNGLYWGIYNLTESIDADHLSETLGGAEEDWFIVKSFPDSDSDGDIIAGSGTRYYVFLDLIKNEDLSDPADYDNVMKYISAEKFADYMILQNFFAVGDWPDNNWAFIMKNGTMPEPGFFYVWDAEKAWLEDDDDQSFKHARYSPYLTDPTLKNGRSYRAVPSRIWRAMISNQDFRMLFADRVYKHLFNDGALTDNNVSTRYSMYETLLTDAVRADQKRWSDDDNRDNFPGILFTHDDWQAQVDRVLENIQDNISYFIDDFKAAALYPDIEPPQFSRNSGYVDSGFPLDLSNPNSSGTIYYTTDGSDPRNSGGSVSGFAQNGGNAITIKINSTTTIKSRIKSSETWSPLRQATFYTPLTPGDIKITEIMYHPPDENGIDGNDFEFIEIKNTGTEKINLSGAGFTEGITYTFDDDTFLGPAEFIVLSKNSDRFFSKYQILPFGVFDGNLNNAGERVTLSDPTGKSLFSVLYDDHAPWPASPDGDGFSLVPVNFNENPDPDNPANWRASKYILGSPGLDDSVRYIPPELPEGPVKILFVTFSSNLTIDDDAVKAHFIDRDFIVQVLDQNSADAADALDKNLVIISESVNSGNVNTKFRNVNIPVLLWDPYLYDDMGMTASAEGVDYGIISKSKLVISAPQHPAAAGLSATVQISSTEREMTYGVPNTNADIIAVWEGDTDKAALFVYDKGAHMPGLTAPARRVGFFVKDGIASDLTDDGWKLFDAAVDWTLEKSSTDISKDNFLPVKYTLSQNYPNPFNPVTTIQYTIPVPSRIYLEIFNIRGQKIKTLTNSYHSAGYYSVQWDGRNDFDQLAANGMYFYRLTIMDNKNNTRDIIKKMIYLK
ncbi:chitobiase/beta-hexosaminidase C-terminal domain-containing protein [candidate division KSB1 bacterium]|nr:chitobiase/beta-hexosaminidase C-terminal domain-containing protein [candidate division KSB1 bacterium]